MYLVIVSIIVFLLVGINLIITPVITLDEKNSAYECGFNKFGKIYKSYFISYYKVALTFLIFDVELVFLIPFLLNLTNNSENKLAGYIFFLILGLGLFFEYFVGLFRSSE